MRLLNYVLEIVNGPMQFDRLEPMLQGVYLDAAAYCWRSYGKAMLITSIERPLSKGVHGVRPCRGLDADVCQGTVYEGGLLPREAENVAGYINARYRYDPKRPEMFVCVYGWRDKTGRHDDHLHFQVFPWTTARG